MKMMRVLIDTHIFLWFFAGTRLSQKTKDFLADTFNNEIYVSHVTAWEISIKYGVDKLELPDAPEIFVPDRIRRARFLELPIKLKHVAAIHNLPPIHKDPFDRLLISQAKAENLHILTVDPNFAEYQIDILNIAKL